MIVVRQVSKAPEYLACQSVQGVGSIRFIKTLKRVDNDWPGNGGTTKGLSPSRSIGTLAFNVVLRVWESLSHMQRRARTAHAQCATHTTHHILASRREMAGMLGKRQIYAEIRFWLAKKGSLHFSATLLF
ncbi:unnamed protein product [Ceratitis capitata]|uniref:(Mediterranean fruit fly) hypothetical protein n=1 Tax=Ceratitis capitata TaxID=7213 RepID=A0A811VHK9_CERCA|nr:unnamed protein product [Ceratitis capitata]